MTSEIWVNARFLTQQKSGVQQFATSICKELLKINSNIKLVAPHNICNKDLAKELNVTICGNKTGQQWEQYSLPKFLNKQGSPLLINLCNSAPLNYSNSIVTIHDLAFLKNPKWFSFSFRNWYKFLIPRITKKAKHIFTVSQFSKDEIVKKLNVDVKTISVLHNGLSQELIQFHKDNKPVKHREKLILIVGSHNPRKNVYTVVSAFKRLALKDYRLVIVGGKNNSFQNEIIKSDKNIDILGYVKDVELWKLYQKAALFVFPSLYEGFGIPILEALSFGCPVLTSELKVFKEVYHNFDLHYTNGDTAENYEQAINTLLLKQSNNDTMLEKIELQYSYFKSAEKLNKLIK